MKAQSIFLTTFTIILLFASFKFMMGEEDIFTTIIGGITGLIISAVVTVVIGSINVLGSGLSSSGVKILFGVATILNLLFQLQIANLPIGIGLANILLNSFNPNAGILAFFGWLISFILTFTALVSGLIMLIKGGE